VAHLSPLHPSPRASPCCPRPRSSSPVPQAALDASLGGGASQEDQLEGVEALLAAVAVTSPCCALATLHDPAHDAAQREARAGVADGLLRTAARVAAAAAASLPPPAAAALTASAAAAAERLTALQGYWAARDAPAAQNG